MAVKVRRERPDQRRHHRVTAPLYVVMGGHRVRAADWSLGGLRVEDFPGDLPGIGATIPLDVTLPFQGFDVSFQAQGEVVRVNPKTRMFAVRFTEIGERERELMSHFIEELIRGAMVDVEETIQRIDVPVTPASLQPDVKPTPEQMVKNLPARRLPVKTMAVSGIYLALGCLVFAYAAIIGYTNFFRMEIKTAVITAPIATIEAQVDGRITTSGLNPGDVVKAGEVMMQVIDKKLERQIELADLEIKERKAKLAYLKRRHADELDRLRGFATVELKNVEQSKIDMEATAGELKIANRQVARLTTLYDRGYATVDKLDQAKTNVLRLQKRLERQRIEVASRADLAKDNIGRRLYTGDDLIGRATEFEAQVSLAQNEVAIAQQQLQFSKQQRRDQAIHAPFDGTVLKLPHFYDPLVQRGDVIAILEQRKQRRVKAFLNQDEVNRIGLGDEALLYVPALGESVSGRVTSIDRTSGFIREQDQRSNPGYGWRGPKDRSAEVTIEFTDPKQVQDHAKFRSGLPVVVVFEQRATNALLSAVVQKFELLL
ncbi:MAG: HlyD family efflux transporter periplasmic adaptor subunit [Pseudomonadota bacterium]